MMFISTVVHLVEIILLSLLGIMFYKLFASYKKWRSLSVSSSSSRGGDRAPKLVTPSLPQNPDYLSISKITVTEEQPHSHGVREKQSSVILTDYIGEFFAESKPMDLTPYRMESVTAENHKAVSNNDLRTLNAKSTDAQTSQIPDGYRVVGSAKAEVADFDQADDDFIQVRPLNLSPVILVHSSKASNNEKLDIDEQAIPTLNEQIDTDSEGYITVASGQNESRANNIMSDKVVLAMLDEAKLVCAS